MAFLSQVQLNIGFSALLMILFVHAYFNMNRNKIRIYIWIIGLTCITIILEILSVLLNNPDYKQFIIFNKLVNMVGFILTPVIPFLGYVFSKEWVNRYQKEKIKTQYMLLLPLVINIIGTLTSYYSGWLFNVTSENLYERGPLFFILPCASYLYFGYNLYFIYTQRKKLNFFELVIFSLFYIVPAIFTGVQLKFSFWLTTWSSAAIIIVITYIFILNDQAYRDSLTGLENRLSYEHFAQNINSKKHIKLCIVFIDIDGLKEINDKYGHYVGDEVIKAFADLLIESFPQRHNKLIRMGGDEFLIIFKEQRQEIVEAYIQDLIKKVELYNQNGEKTYKLRFSYGIACYSDIVKDIYQLLEYADQLMYEQKRRKKNNPILYQEAESNR